MAKIIAISNQKGGVGKTTTAISLAGALAKFNKKILLIDLDPQGNCGRGMGIDITIAKLTVYDVLTSKCDINSAITHTTTPNVDIISSNLKLAMIDTDLQGQNRPFYVLKVALEKLDDKYDYVIFDCPPSLGILNLNGLCAAEAVLIPVQCEYYALEGVAQILSSISKVQQDYNPNLEILGFLLTMYDSRLRLATEVTQEIRGLFKEKTFVTQIPRNASIAEAAAEGKPVTLFRPTAAGSQAYIALAREILSNE